MDKKNPFIFGRLEFEQNAVLFMPKAFCNWVNPKPQLFEGVRGSGKSSILKSLNWEVFWKISDIQVNGPKEVLSLYQNPKYIGVYYRVEDMDIDFWDTWKKNYGIVNAQKYFGTYLNFLYLDLLLNALANISKRDQNLFTDKIAEQNFVNQMLQQCFPEERKMPRLAEHTFVALRSVISKVHTGLRNAVFSALPDEMISQTYPVASPGELIQAFGEVFIKNYPKQSDWTIMALLDDCNLLEEWQAVVINTAVAKAKKPVSYKLSSVTNFYPTRNTLIKSRTIIEHDIDTIQISDYMDNLNNYLRLLEGVCRVRIEKFFDKSLAQKFNLKKFLGEFKLEEALASKLNSSENEEAHNFFELAKKGSKDGKSVPITKTWLFLKNIRKVSKAEGADQKLAERRNRSSYYNKWSRTAAISLCKEFRLDFPYFGLKPIIYISYGSIREFLRIMSEIWESSNTKSVSHFVNSTIDPIIQNSSIRNASLASFNAIDNKVLFEDGPSLQAICKRLGQLFSKFQTYPYILTAPETAALKLKEHDLTRDEDIKALINKAVMAGVIVRKKDANKAESIALHPILSPMFGISFRNPFYYPQSISFQQLKSLITANDVDANVTIDNILKNRLQRSKIKPEIKLTGQYDLFHLRRG